MCVCVTSTVSKQVRNSCHVIISAIYGIVYRRAQDGCCIQASPPVSQLIGSSSSLIMAPCNPQNVDQQFEFGVFNNGGHEGQIKSKDGRCISIKNCQKPHLSTAADPVDQIRLGTEDLPLVVARLAVLEKSLGPLPGPPRKTGWSKLRASDM